MKKVPKAEKRVRINHVATGPEDEEEESRRAFLPQFALPTVYYNNMVTSDM